ncbi:MAG: hypothetical protein ACE5J2_00420 [Nitrososphaerales archaeon]
MEGTGSRSLNKGKLFGIISAAVIAILLVPIIIPHAAHTMFPHLLLHLGAFIMAAFLVSIGIISYRRLRSARLLLTALAFVALTGIEALYLANTSLMDGGHLTILETGIEVPHILALFMVAMFSIGVLKVQ